jgi:hypothetical protein
VKGTDPWLNKALETDEEMLKEITNKEIVKEVFLTLSSSPPPTSGYTPSLCHCLGFGHSLGLSFVLSRLPSTALKPLCARLH